MKNIFQAGLWALLGITLVGLSSCYKKFDPESYKPSNSIGGFNSSREIAPSNLVGYWAFNGSLIDSVSGQSGRNVGTSFSGGVKGQAMQGADKSYVLFTPGNAILNMTSFTITYWVNSGIPTNGIIGLVNLSNKNAFWGNVEMFFENGSTATAGKFRIKVINNGKDEIGIDKDDVPGLFNSWVNLALSYDEATSTFKFYVNGTVQQTKVVNGLGALNFENGGDIVFGAPQFMTTPSLTTAHGAEPWASYLTGQLDEVRIYNKALSDDEINSLVKLEGRGK